MQCAVSPTTRHVSTALSQEALAASLRSACVQQGAGCVPGWSNAIGCRDQGRRLEPEGAGSSCRPEARGTRLRQGLDPIYSDVSPDGTVLRIAVPLVESGTDATSDAALEDLLSVGAAYGLIVAVFQWDWVCERAQLPGDRGIASWLPMFLFVILFGLSMDYRVFILSRVKEYFDRGMSTEDAVAAGSRSTAGVVTSAAVVMVFVFGVFALMPILDMKEMGIGLAAAVLIDATIVRAVLLPATMTLLGKRNWYLPTWLEWLPRLEPGASVDVPVIDAEPARAAA